MTGPHFVDSNILVYSHDRAAGERQRLADKILKALWRTRSGRLSNQVLEEFYVVATRKLAEPVPRDIARRDQIRVRVNGLDLVIDAHEQMSRLVAWSCRSVRTPVG